MSIPCVVIEKEGPKHSVVSSDFLRDFESHQLGEGWLGVGRFVPHPQHLFLVWYGHGSGTTEKIFVVTSRETCNVLLFHFCTGAKDSGGDFHLVSTQTHDFKDFLDCLRTRLQVFGGSWWMPRSQVTWTWRYWVKSTRRTSTRS